MKYRILSLLAFYSLCVTPILWAQDSIINLGVLSLFPRAQMQRDWEPFADYLTQQLPGYRIQLHVLDPQEMNEALNNRLIDFVITNPSHYIFLKEKLGLSAPLATLLQREGSLSLNSFGGIIFTRSNRDDINSLADIKEKKIAVVTADESSFGGFVAQAYELHRAGIHLKPHQFIITGWPQENVFTAVLDGNADIGFTRTGLLERFEREGIVPAGSIKIIGSQRLPGLPFLTSTPLYPEWPFVALPHVDKRLASLVVAIILRIDANESQSGVADMYSFTIPATYSVIDNILRALRLPPHEATPQFNLLDVWSRYRTVVIILIVTLMCSLIVYLQMLIAKKRLDSKLFELDQRQEELKENLSSADRALRILSAGNQALLRSAVEDEQLIQVCRIAVEVGDYAASWVGMARNDEKKSIVPVAWFGFEKDWPEKINMSWDGGEGSASAVGSAICTGTIQLRRDILNDPSMVICHEHARKLGFQTSIALPLRVQGEVIGALAICARELHAFQPNEVELLSELADDLAFGIQTIRMREAHEKAQEHVRQLAYYDHLTGLPNRILFLEKLEQLIGESANTQRPFLLTRIDLLHLREINESHGHALGDQLIVEVAHQLRMICGPECLVSRLGGDDFTLLCPGIEQHDVEPFLKKVLASLNSPCILSGQRLIAGGALGYVMYPADGQRPEELMPKADMAASLATSAGGGICSYQQEMGDNLARIMMLSSHLEEAIQNNSLSLYYQPKIDLETGHLSGAEALLRWNDPTLGWISPGEFIPIAESRGQMPALGEWVLRRACLDLRQWHDEGIDIPGRIAVNISVRQFDSPELLNEINNILETTGVTPDRLELELTESILMSEPERINKLLRELKNHGFALSLDDFGTGYSSLAYLKRFPLDTLKIDREFVRDMLEDHNDRAIVSTIVAIAEQFGLITVAEGVEKHEQAMILQKLGCHQAQGFYYSGPVPAAEFQRLWLAETELLQQRQIRQGVRHV